VKILIIGIARSGTTSLLRGISSQGFYDIGEPYNKWVRSELAYPLEELDKHDNIVVKHIALQKPKNYKGTWIEFLIEFSKSFDRIIFLDRSDFEEHYESTLNLWYKSHIQKQSVMSKWSSEDIPDLFRVGFASGGGRHALQKEKDEFKEVVKTLNGNITFYEDLYGNDRDKSLEIISSWNLPLKNSELCLYLNPKYKLKKDSKKLL
jgi:hypothetical protein